jgi:hypothetical protein
MPARRCKRTGAPASRRLRAFSRGCEGSRRPGGVITPATLARPSRTVSPVASPVTTSPTRRRRSMPTYLETDDERKRTPACEVAQRCEEQQEKTPADVNAWYLHAFALGRYSQSISVVKALAQGLGGKIKHSLTKALELATPARRCAYRARRLSRRGDRQGRGAGWRNHLRGQERYRQGTCLPPL